LPCVAEFVRHTLEVASGGRVHEVAAVFAFGREAIIPGMFRAIVAQLCDLQPARWSPFLYYLNRHIEVDAGTHARATRELVASLCGSDPERWEESARAAEAALRARQRLWDALLARVLSCDSARAVELRA
jgi:hypothetical protein